MVKEMLWPTTTKPVELDTSSECAACEAFVTVFNDRLNNKSVNIDEIDLMELCNEVEIKHKDQVNSSLIILSLFWNCSSFSNV